MNWFKKKKTPEAAPAPAPAAMAVSDFVTTGRIRRFPAGTSKEAAIAELVRSLPCPDPEAALQAVFGRERMGSTLLENGVLIPHARLVDVPDVLVAVGLCPDGIDDVSSGGKARIVVLFVGPANYMKRNLDFLASVSALLQDENVVEALLASPDGAAAYAAILRAEGR
jgi:mannitol/fructose-specific phosphotransferase system IIA component (Ntr-type)